MSELLLSATQLVKRYCVGSQSTSALNGVSLHIRRGEFVSISGPSGSGKSTLLSVLGLLEDYDSGSYEVSGVDVGAASRDTLARVRNRHFGFVFQSFNLIPELSVLENIALPLRLRKGLRNEEIVERSIHELRSVGLEEKARSLPSQLSGGQQQRVAIARAVVGKPDVLLADEPTGNLDSVSAESVMRLICRLHDAGTTTVLVTHDSKWAALASRILSIVDGKLSEADVSAASGDVDRLCCTKPSI